MERVFQIIRGTRSSFQQLVGSLSLEALNKIPVGFNNNIIWNFGHIIATQQVLCYTYAGQKPLIDEAYIAKYRKGSRPESFIEQEELDVLKQYLFSTIERTAVELQNNSFTGSYTPLKTSMGIAIASVEDAIKAISMHDGLHLGYAMALKRLVV